MDSITEDRWDDEIWGAAGESSKGEENTNGRPKLIFYFGQKVSCKNNQDLQELC